MTNNEAKIDGREIVSTRILNAPRELVWLMWTDPKHIAQWWGPNGFTNTIHEMNVKTGGLWKLTMHGPNGVDYPNKIVYDEVVKPERIVYTHGNEGDMDNFQAIVTFDEQGGETKLTMRMIFKSAEMLQKIATEFGAVEGNTQTLNKLEEQLTKVEEEVMFTISRTFAAPRDLVWKALSEAESLAQWWGPKGFEMVVGKLDFRPGGIFHYSMKAPNGQAMWGKFTYREMVAPERIVFINSFSDAEGGVTPNPYMPSWPLEIFNILTLEENAGKTTLTMKGFPINATEEGIKTFMAGHQSMEQGFKGTWEQLDEYLAKVGSKSTK